MQEIKFKVKKVVAEGVFVSDVFCDHKWLYYNYEKWCRICERAEILWAEIRKACNPPTQANSIVKEVT